MRKRRSFSGEEKVVILKEHLVSHESVSDLCDKHEIHPNLFYKWQKEFFENGAAAFKKERKNDKSTKLIKELEAQVKHKDGVIIELLEDHITLKKNLGGK
jgi:transposase